MPMPEGTLRASANTPCPICKKEDACFLVEDDSSDQLSMVTCYRMSEVPDDLRHLWTRGGLARNGHIIFLNKASKPKRKHFPVVVNLEPRELGNWAEVTRTCTEPKDSYRPGELLKIKGRDEPYIARNTKSGKRGVVQVVSQFSTVTSATDWGMGGPQDIDLKEIEGTFGVDGDEHEQVTEYLYPDHKGNPLGKVIRKQWSDKRRWYADGSRKLKGKTVFKSIWQPGEDEKSGQWSFKGIGTRKWPIYRRAEAIAEIMDGGIVFAVGGEACVEAMGKALGLVATTSDGGEGNYLHIIDELAPAFEAAISSGKKPLLVWWPDFDLAGETTYGTNAVWQSRRQKIPCIVIDPMSVWEEMPHKGDVKDWVESSGLTPEKMRQQLTIVIDAEIEQQEVLLRSKKQGDRWNAPKSHEGEIGYFKAAKATEEDPDPEPIFKPLTDFDLDIERMIIDPETGGGMFVTVKLADERASKRIFLGGCDFSSPQKFKDAIKQGLGYPVFCNLTPTQIESFLRVKAQRYRIVLKGKTYRLADRSGKQGAKFAEDRCWVFPRMQFTPQGDPIEETVSGWMWDERFNNSIERPTTPQIAEPRDGAIARLIEPIRRAFGENTCAVLLGMGWAASSLYYDDVTRLLPGLCIFTYDGVPGSGKSTAGKCAMAIVGTHTSQSRGCFSKISISAVFQRVKRAGCLPHFLDDPEKEKEREVDETLKIIYEAGTREVRGNTQNAHSGLMLASNHSIGATNPATASRCLRVFLPKLPAIDEAAFGEVYEQMDQASGEFSKLLKIGFLREEVKAMVLKLRPHLNYAHERVPQSMGCTLVYTKKVLEIAGITDIDVEAWAINVLCPQLNEQDEDGDFLREFLQRIFTLENMSKAGEWNMRWCRNGDTLALYMPSLWPSYRDQFQPSYNEKVIKSLMKQAGLQSGKQKFHANIDESKNYSRSKQHMAKPTPPEMKLRSCWEIPKSFLLGLDPDSEADFNGVTEVTEVTEEPEPLQQLALPQLPIPTNSLKEKVTKVTGGGEPIPSPCDSSEGGLDSSSVPKMQKGTQKNAPSYPKTAPVTRQLPEKSSLGNQRIECSVWVSGASYPSYLSYPQNVPGHDCVSSRGQKGVFPCASSEGRNTPLDWVLSSKNLARISGAGSLRAPAWTPDCVVWTGKEWLPAKFRGELKQMKIHPEGGLCVQAKAQLWPSLDRITVWKRDIMQQSEVVAHANG